MENTATKTTSYMNLLKFLSGLKIIVKHRDELSADMSLIDFLDWLDEKSKTEDYTSDFEMALQELEID